MWMFQPDSTGDIGKMIFQVVLLVRNTIYSISIYSIYTSIVLYYLFMKITHEDTNLLWFIMIIL